MNTLFLVDSIAATFMYCIWSKEGFINTTVKIMWLILAIINLRMSGVFR